MKKFCFEVTKCPLLAGLLALLTLAPAALAVDQTWVNNAVISSPPTIAPQIDAINFVNNGVMDLILPSSSEFSGGLFQTSDTLNYTNNGYISVYPGIDFETYPNSTYVPVAGVPFNKMAANFVNTAGGASNGIISLTSPFSFLPGITGLFTIIGGNSKFIASATNLVNSGTITMDNPGLIQLTGEDVDLTRGTVSGPLIVPTPDTVLLDYGLGTDTNLDWDPSQDLGPIFAISSDFYTQLNPQFPNFPGTRLILFPSEPYMQTFPTNSAPGEMVNSNLVIYRAVFLEDLSRTNTVQHNVYFAPTGTSADTAVVEWVGTYIDPVTGQTRTNYLYLGDDYLVGTATNLLIGNAGPANFNLAQSTTELITNAPQAEGFTPIFDPGFVTNTYSYANVDVASVPLSTNAVQTLTNLIGRVQITATHNLNLTKAQIIAPTYLSLQATNNLVSNAGAVIEAPFSDLNIGTSSSSLTVSNLLVPSLPIWSGNIEAWSTRWTDQVSNSIVTVDTNGVATTNVVTITNDFRVLLVLSDLSPTASASQQDVTFHQPGSLTISDTLNIMRNFYSDAQVLTVTSNSSGAYSTLGELNLFNPDVFWSTALPNLQYLTNWGVINTLNLANFAGNMTSPYSDRASATPYQAFVNHGAITNQGTFIDANYFEDDGIIQDPLNGLAIEASTALATNGLFSATNGTVSISAPVIVLSNQVIQAGSSLTLAPSTFFSDGYYFLNQFGHIVTSNSPANTVTNGNVWTASGFNVLGNPGTGDLLGTTVTNFAGTNNNVLNTWAGADLGNSPAGFVRNMAMGRLVLDGADKSVFTFVGATANNALYVDDLEMEDYTTNRDVNGNLLGVNIAPGMKIYYAEAKVNGVSIAEKLNGKNGGGFNWVSNYAGVYSSTNLSYPGGTVYTFNQALVESPVLDSDGDGTVNSQDPTPIPTNNPPATVTWSGPSGPGFAGSPAALNRGNGTGTGPGSNGGPGTAASALPFPQSQPGNGWWPGIYNGLFYDTNGVAPESSGYFSASVSASRKFSAKLLLGDIRYSFAGTFDRSLEWSNTISPARNPLSVQLNLGGGQITGQVSNGNWTAQLLANRAGFDGKTHLAPAKGSYSMTISSDGSTTNNLAFGSVSVDVRGNVKWSGKLPDGAKVTQKSALSAGSVWPLYAPLNGGAGAVISWIQFTNNTGLGGPLLWIKPAGADGHDPAGFTNVTEAAGSRISVTKGH